MTTGKRFATIQVDLFWGKVEWGEGFWVLGDDLFAVDGDVQLFSSEEKTLMELCPIMKEE